MKTILSSLLAAAIVLAASPSLSNSRDDCLHGMPRKAVGGCTEEINSGRWSPPFLTKLYFSRAVNNSLINRIDPAIRDFTSVIKLNNRHVHAYYNRGLLFAKKRQFKRAAYDYSFAIRYGMNHEGMFVLRGFTYEKLGKYRNAIIDYNRALRINPRNRQAALKRRQLLARIAKVRSRRATRPRNPTLKKRKGPTRSQKSVRKKQSNTAVRGLRTMTLRKHPGSSHFLAQVALNGRRVIMMVDTGATRTIVSRHDAKRAGINLAQLTYNIPVRTANGVVHLAVVTIRVFSLGPRRIWNLRILVSPQVSRSLLGMNVLRRFESFEFKGDELILRW